MARRRRSEEIDRKKIVKLLKEGLPTLVIAQRADCDEVLKEGKG
jgi:hypothetical protein